MNMKLRQKHRAIKNRSALALMVGKFLAVNSDFCLLPQVTSHFTTTEPNGVYRLRQITRKMFVVY